MDAMKRWRQATSRRALLARVSTLNAQLQESTRVVNDQRSLISQLTSELQASTELIQKQAAELRRVRGVYRGGVLEGLTAAQKLALNSMYGKGSR